MPNGRVAKGSKAEMRSKSDGDFGSTIKYRTEVNPMQFVYYNASNNAIKYGYENVATKMTVDVKDCNAKYGSLPQPDALKNIMCGLRNFNEEYFVRGHLLNKELGGQGTPNNLFPITSSANSKHSESVEKEIKSFHDKYGRKINGTYNVEVKNTNGNKLTTLDPGCELQCTANLTNTDDEKKLSIDTKIESKPRGKNVLYNNIKYDHTFNYINNDKSTVTTGREKRKNVNQSELISSSSKEDSPKIKHEEIEDQIEFNVFKNNILSLQNIVNYFTKRNLDFRLENGEKSLKKLKKPLEELKEPLEELKKPLEKLQERLEELKEPLEELKEPLEELVGQSLIPLKLPAPKEPSPPPFADSDDFEEKRI